MPIWRNTTGNFLWNTAGNWLADGTGSGVPTVASDAVFDNSSPNCIVDTASAVCRNLNFNSGTGFANTIGMNNNITVGHSSQATPNQSVTLSSSMSISGTGAILTRINGTTTLRSNGKTWPNTIGMNTAGTSILTTLSTVVIVDNWTVGGLSLGPGAAHTLTVSGASTITVNGNFQTNPNNTSSSIRAVAGAVTSIVLASGGTWSNSASVIPIGLGLNVTINAPGQVITIADRAYWGGIGVISGISTLRYIAGTVVHNGTFHILVTTANANQYVDLSGSTSSSATNTGTTGINFSNLSFRTSAVNNNSLTNISNNICVVGNLSVDTVGGGKGPVTLVGGTIYANSNLTLNGWTDTSSTTTLILQGTGTWSENNPLGVIAGNGWGFRGMTIVINTTGTITLGSYVGFNSNSSLTYTAGSFVTTNFGIRVFTATFTGFGSASIQMGHIVYQASGGNPAQNLTLNDSLPFRFSLITFVQQAAGNNVMQFIGTAGFTTDSISLTNSPSIAGASLLLNFIGSTSIQYRITTSLTLIHIPITGSDAGLQRSTGTGSVNFILENGASQDVFYFYGGFLGEIIDSSLGQTIWTRSGAVTYTINWKQWDYPKTQYGSFLI